MLRYTRSYFGAENHELYAPKQRKSYGFFRFVWDIAMVLLTHGLWLIWIFVREMRKR